MARSAALGEALGLADWLDGEEALQALSGNVAPRGTWPFASVYSSDHFVWSDVAFANVPSSFFARSVPVAGSNSLR